MRQKMGTRQEFVMIFGFECRLNSELFSSIKAIHHLAINRTGFEGEKLLIKQNQVKINIIPLKVKDMRVKNMWGMLREDQDLLRYFQDNCIEDETTRCYFFSINSASRPVIFK